MQPPIVYPTTVSALSKRLRAAIIAAGGWVVKYGDKRDHSVFDIIDVPAKRDGRRKWLRGL